MSHYYRRVERGVHVLRVRTKSLNVKESQGKSEWDHEWQQERETGTRTACSQRTFSSLPDNDEDDERMDTMRRPSLSPLSPLESVRDQRSAHPFA